MPGPEVLLYGVPLAFLAGFVDAIAGGGGVITLPTLYFMGLAPAQVVATNKLLAIFGSTSASLSFWRRGWVDKALLLRLAPLALLGSALGAHLVLGFRNDAAFRTIVAGLILLVGLLVVTNKKLGSENRYAGLNARTLSVGLLAALAIGVYDGFFGPGTGTFLMFVFVRFLRFDFVTGSGNARVVNFVTNAGAFVTFLLSGAMVWWIGCRWGWPTRWGPPWGRAWRCCAAAPLCGWCTWVSCCWWWDGCCWRAERGILRGVTLDPHESEADAAIRTLLASHNDGADVSASPGPHLTIVTCMDFRIHLRLPENFAFVLRTGGANPRPVEPYLAFSVARPGIHAVALIGHTDCAMVRPDPDVVNDLPIEEEQKRLYRGEIAGLAIADAPAFTRREASRLEGRLGLPVVPLLYRVEDHKLERL